MGSFLQNVVAGVLATFVCLLTALLARGPISRLKESFQASYRIRKVLCIERVARRRVAIAGLLAEELTHTSTLWVLAFKAYSILDRNNRVETLLYRALAREASRLRDLKILLLDPRAVQAIEQRIAQIRTKTKNDAPEHHANDILRSAQQIRDVLETRSDLSWGIRHFSESLKWNVIVTDSRVFISFYIDDELGPNSPTLVVERTGPIGQTFARFFDDIWENRSVTL